jgi:hypothetical protein
MEAAMPKFGILTGAVLALLLLAGCGGNSPDFAFSQQRAINADMDASFQHGASLDSHDTGIQFTNSLDSATSDRPASLGGALGFR